METENATYKIYIHTFSIEAFTCEILFSDLDE